MHLGKDRREGRTRFVEVKESLVPEGREPGKGLEEAWDAGETGVSVVPMTMPR